MAHKNIHSIYDLIKKAQSEKGDKVFILNQADERKITYNEFFNDVNAAYRYFSSLEIKSGDKIAVISESSYLGYVFITAALSFGITISPLSTSLKENDLDYALSLICPRVVFVSRECKKKMSYIDKFSNKYTFITMDEQCSLGKGLTETGELNEISADGSIIIFTTGSTGRSKGVELTVQNILANIYDVVRYYGISDDSRLIAYFPLTTIGSTVINILSTAYAGASVFLCKPFLEQSLFLAFVKDFWNIIQNNKISHIYANPSVLNMLLKFQKSFKTLTWKPKMIISSMAPLSKETQNAVEDLTGIPVLNGYGLTETTCRSLFGSYDDEKRRKCSLGKPIYPTKIINEAGNECKPYEVGEILISGPTVMKGYYNDSASTGNVIKDGWFYTGDLGYYDEEHDFYIVGRKKNIIIKHGNKISIEEVEEALLGYKKMYDFAVVGVPDENMGEKVVLFCVEYENEPIDQNELVKFCKDNLSEYKCPDLIKTVKAIPRSASGKILREELKKLLISEEKN
ncbi:class I adenylate-forming enzyme family protein [Acetivibrio straminisolvens]|jgi:acyl-CoA synthetase (AMP-forming)/AMP-acid ligase II|uniref:Long-chain-fatty-acid-CoA ligase n=1 Tax=Acetivibrio straminisolvens JCM 21531 TaxID=1294263 RepID=W4V4V1_9FIRM|nr:class I adenylate-forming enzyme family protein [Acetivibrio straminisolvens]GAE88192.1 long-chain-fatty-acid-CoA ligase [Acetivibrio straminisolvens JCM 21531]